MTWYDGLIVGVCLFLAFQLDGLSTFFVGQWYEKATRKKYEKATRKKCEMCNQPAVGAFTSDPDKGMIDLCGECMNEAMHGAAKNAIHEAARNAQDDYDAETDY